MDDRRVAALQRLVGAGDQLGTGLRQHLDPDVRGNGVLLDDLADEVEIGLRGGGEADLDLLVAHCDQQVEHAALAGRRHRVDQGLVAVTQVDRAPQRRLVDHLGRPGPIGQVDRSEAGVPTEGHLTTALPVVRVLISGDVAGGGAQTRDRGSAHDVGSCSGESRARPLLPGKGGGRPAARSPATEEPVWNQAPSRPLRSRLTAGKPAAAMRTTSWTLPPDDGPLATHPGVVTDRGGRPARPGSRRPRR